MSARFDWFGLARSLLVLAGVGWAAAGTPFRGDQALFAQYAERMHAGAVLYRDLWELTNPGVFWFYQLAGALFGFSEDGIHLFEWLWWVAFVQVVSFAAKRSHGLTRWPLAPAVLVGGVYFFTSCSDPSHLTKAEGLAAFPLFAAGWLACMAVEPPRPRGWLLLAAGVAGGVAVLFKFAFGLCVVAAWLPVVFTAVRRRELVRLFLFPAGLLLPLLAAAGYFVSNGAGDDAVRCLLVTPREVLRHAEPAGFDRLANSVRWFVEVYSAVLAVAFAGMFATVARRVDPLVASLSLMAFAAVPVVLVQRWSWWTYHFLLVGVPVGVLAAYTWPVLVKAVAERWGRPFARWEKLAAVAVGAALFLPVLGHGANAYLRLPKHHFGLTADDRTAARLNTGRAYTEAAGETAWLSHAKPGPIFVAGDPLFHTLSGRPAATAVHGWSLELLPPDVWAELLTELRAARPVYVFVEHGEQHIAELIAARGPDLAAWLKVEYTEARRSRLGVWYERRE
jgi:hypothetical protein